MNRIIYNESTKSNAPDTWERIHAHCNYLTQTEAEDERRKGRSIHIW